MSLSKLKPGSNPPHDVNVVVEIPANSDPIKYEIDKESGAMCVDRFLSTTMRYPCDYGYIPSTLSEDGDPVDVLVVTPFPLTPSAVVRCRPVGMLKMTDEAGVDTKILAVPITKLTKMYENVKQPWDLPSILLSQISHFFEHYKDLEENKWVRIGDWAEADEAQQEISDAIARYQKDAGA